MSNTDAKETKIVYENGWALCFQYHHFNEKNSAYRFVWRKPNGHLHSGLAIIPSLSTALNLISQATVEGWGNRVWENNRFIKSTDIQVTTGEKQEVSYLFPDGHRALYFHLHEWPNGTKGYRFFWRDTPGGKMKPARGQAILPSIPLILSLFGRAIDEGWGDYRQPGLDTANPILPEEEMDEDGEDE